MPNRQSDNAQLFVRYSKELIKNKGLLIFKGEYMKYKEIWNFEYKGIKCQIVHWGVKEMASVSMGSIWNGYIFINKKQLPRNFRKLLCSIHTFKLSSVRKYWSYRKLEDYFNFHGGITYYELIRDEFTSKPIGIKVGCDYAHSWDEGHDYNENDIKRYLENSVNTFIRHFPNYLVWRFTDGKFVKPNLLK